MAWERIPVVMRHEDDTEAKPVGECSSADLDDLCDLVRRWGTYPEGVSASGQFNAYVGAFEIILHDDV